MKIQTNNSGTEFLSNHRSRVGVFLVAIPLICLLTSLILAGIYNSYLSGDGSQTVVEEKQPENLSSLGPWGRFLLAIEDGLDKTGVGTGALSAYVKNYLGVGYSRLASKDNGSECTGDDCQVAVAESSEGQGETVIKGEAWEALLQENQEELEKAKQTLVQYNNEYYLGDQISGERLIDATVNARAKLIAGTITTELIAEGAIGKNQIAYRSITSSRLHTSAVDSRVIKNGTIQGKDLSGDISFSTSGTINIDDSSINNLTVNKSFLSRESAVFLQGLTSHGDIMPNADGAYYLGSQEKQWARIYGGTVVASVVDASLMIQDGSRLDDLYINAVGDTMLGNLNFGSSAYFITTTGNIGSLTSRWGSIYAQEIDAVNLITGSVNLGGTISDNFRINTDNATADTEDSYLTFERGTEVPNAILAWNAGTDNFSFNFPLSVTGTITGTTLTDGTFSTTGGVVTGATWNANTVEVAYGGTGATTFTQYGLLYGNGTGALQAMAVGGDDQVVIGHTGAAPTWTDAYNLGALIDHGTLLGLGDDDHAQYALLAGRAGGQVLIGGTGTTDDLTLQTTTGVGAVGADMHFLVGNNGATEAMTILNSGNVGIGTTTPLVKLDVRGSLAAGTNGTEFTVATSGNVTGGTYNGLTLTALGTGYSIAGGTASRTLTVNETKSLSDYMLIDGTRAFTAAVTGVDPTVAGHLATKGYVDQVAQGLGWQDSVLSKSLTAPPGAPTSGDRYIVGTGATGAWAGHDDEIAQYNGATWDFQAPSTGFAVWVEDENQLYVYYGGAWLVFGSTLDHSNLTGLTGSDDHTQYALLAGRSGGQVLIGGTDTTDGLTLQTTSGVGTTGANMHFLVGNNGATEALTILNSGYVGIGTTDPQAALQVIGNIEMGAGSSTRQLRAYNATRTEYGELELYNLATGDVTLKTTFATGDIILAPGNAMAMTLDSSGSVGIGTATPSNKLHVEGTGGGAAGIYLNDAAPGTTTNTLYNDAGTLKWNGAEIGAGSVSGTIGYIAKFTAADAVGDSVIYESGGSLGIGTTSPGATLDVRGSLAAGTNGTEFVVNTSGSVTAGAWNGTTIAVNRGGTGLTSYTTGDLLYASAATTLAGLADVAVGSVLTSGGVGTAPAWSTIASLGSYIDHDTLAGLTDDDHTQYALLAGRAGGQYLTGGINASDNLIFRATSNATQGYVGVMNAATYQTASTMPSFQIGSTLDTYADSGEAYKWEFYTSGADATNPGDLSIRNYLRDGGNTEVMTLGPTGYVGIGTTNPGYQLDVSGDAYFSGGIGVRDGLPTSNRAINSDLSVSNASGYGFRNAYAITGTLTADRTNYAAFNQLTNTADNTSYSNSLYGALNQVVNSDGYGYNAAYGAFNSIENSDSSKTNAISYGSYSSVNNLGTGTLTTVEAMRGVVINNVGGTITTARGAYGYVRNDEGTMGTAYGVQGHVVQNIIGGTIDTAYGGLFNVTQTAGTITNAYGVYINTIGGSNTYGLYQASSANDNYFAGKVGIGTLSPYGKFEVRDDTDSYSGILGYIIQNPVTTEASGDTFNVRGETSANALAVHQFGTGNIAQFLNDNDAKVTIDNSGNVGIGTTSPITKLTVSGTGTFGVNPSQGAVGEVPAGVLVIGNNNLTLLPSDAAGSKIMLGYRYSGTIWYSGLEVASVASGYGDLLLMKTGGQVGIGTTTPTNKLHVQGVGGGEAGIYLNSAVPSATSYTLYNNAGTLTWNGVALATGSSVSGTTGYIPKFTGASSLGNSVIYETGGNIGIGTTSPVGKLSIEGAGTANEDVLRVNNPGNYASRIWLRNSSQSAYWGLSSTTVADTAVGTGGLAGAMTLGINADKPIQFWSTTSGVASAKMTITTAGYVGIGTNNPSGELDIEASDAYADVYFNGTTGGQMIFQDDGVTEGYIWSNDGMFIRSESGLPLTLGSNGSANDLIIASSGSVGIGTLTPTNKLHIQGTGGGAAGIYMNSAVPSATSYTLYNNAGTLMWNGAVVSTGGSSVSGTTGYLSKFTTATSLGDSVIYESGGNIGIGTASPGAALEIYKAGENLRLSTAVGSSPFMTFFEGTDRRAYMQYVQSTNYLNIVTEESGSHIVLNPSGNVGIGTTGPVEKLDIDGGVLARGALLVGNVSGTYMSYESGDTSTFMSYGPDATTRGQYQFLIREGDGANGLTPLVISNTGNVGIGTTTPESLLSVSSETNGSGTVIENVNTYYLAGSTDETVSFQGSFYQDSVSALRAGGVVRIGKIGDFSDNANASSFMGFWTRNASVLSEKVRIDNSGNVGIGTTTPGIDLGGGTWDPSGVLMEVENTGGYARVVVDGNAAQLLMSDNGGGADDKDFSLIVDGGVATFASHLDTGVARASNILSMDMGNGRVGMGTNGPATRLHVYDGASGGTPYADTELTIEDNGRAILQFLTPNTSDQYVMFGDPEAANKAYLGYNHSTDLMTLYSGGGKIYMTGSVGVGTTAPLTQTDIFGLGQLTAAIADAGDLTGTLLVSSNSASAGAGGAVLFGAYPTGGKFFAGIKGLAVSSSTNTRGDLAFSTRNAVADAALTERMRILSTGEVGIGTTAPSVKLDVNGNGRFRSVGSGTYSNPLNITSDGTLTTSTSDIRLKKNLTQLSGTLDKVKQLKSYTFNWINDPEERTDIGLMAQELALIYPALTFTNEVDGYMGIRYPQLAAVLVEAIKDLDAKYDPLSQNLIVSDEAVASMKQLDASQGGVMTNVVAGSIGVDTPGKEGALTIDEATGRLYAYYGGGWHYFSKDGGFQIPNYETAPYNDLSSKAKKENSKALAFEGSNYDDYLTQKLSPGEFLIPYVDEYLPDGAIHGLYARFEDVKNKMFAKEQDQLADLAIKAEENSDNLQTLEDTWAANFEVVGDMEDQIDSLTLAAANNNELVEELSDELVTVDEKADDNTKALDEIEKRVAALEQAAGIQQGTGLDLFNDLMGTTEDGRLALNGDVTVTGSLNAEEVVVSMLAIKNTSEDEKVIGRALIYPEDAGMGDGKSVKIKTMAVTGSAKIFLSFENNPGSASWVEKVEGSDGYEGFWIKLAEPVAKDTQVSWWIVEEDGASDFDALGSNDTEEPVIQEEAAAEADTVPAEEQPAVEEEPLVTLEEVVTTPTEEAASPVL